MNKTKKIAFGMGIALVVLAVLTAPALGYGSEAWLDPENSTGEYGEADVLVYFNFTESVGETVSGQDDIFYDKNCVEIVTIDQSMSAFSWNTHNWFNDSYHPDDWTWYNYKDLSPTHTCVRIQWDQPEGPISPGSYTYAVLTLHCNCSSGCGSDLIHGYNEMNNEMGDFITGGFIFYNGTYKCTTGAVEADNVTNADIPVSGTVSGDHTLTWESDNNYESITEEVTKGKPERRKSLLEHKWTIDVISGTKTSVTFHLEANRTDSGEGDDFEFAYWNGTEYVFLVKVNKTGESIYTCEMQKDISGNVTIRVMDTDREMGNSTPDTIYINHMFIHSVLGEPDETSPVITNVRNTTTKHDSAIIEWDTDEISDSLVKYGTTPYTYTDQVYNGADVTSHIIELTELNASTTYYYVVKSTDPSENSNESTQYNFTTEPKPSEPDLEITDIWCEVANKPNTYYIYYNITNNGADAGKSDSNWTIDGDTGTDKVAPLASGQTKKEKITYQSTTPPTTVKVCANYDHKIAESDYTNNCMEVTDVTCPKP